MLDDTDDRIPTFELAPATEQLLAANRRPSRERTGWKSTNRDEASIAEATNRPRKSRKGNR